MMRSIIAGLAFLLVALSSRSVGAVSCKVAILAPLTGGGKDYGIGVQNGVGLALDEAIEMGIDFNISVYDTMCVAAKSAEAMKAAIADKVQAVIGDVCSGASLASLALANVAQIPMISPTATSTQLSTHDFFFRTCPNDNYQGLFLASILSKKNFSNIVVVYGVSEPYGEGIAHALISSLYKSPKTKGSLLGSIGFKSTDESGNYLNWTTGQLTSIMTKKPDVFVILSNNAKAMIQAVTELRQKLGYKGALAGADSLAGLPTLATDYSDVFEGMFGSSLYLGTAAFKRKYVDAYGGDINNVPPAAAQAYDALKILQKVCFVNKGGIERVATGKEIQVELSQKYRTKDGGTSGFTLSPAATGRVVFDENGDDTVTQYDILLLKEGQWSPVDISKVNG